MSAGSKAIKKSERRDRKGGKVNRTVRAAKAPTFTSHSEALRNHSDACAYFGPYSPEAFRALADVTAWNVSRRA